MSNSRREVEARGPDVETAIETGLSKLGVGRNDVIVEVVDEGSRGLLGIGSREAVVRLTPMTVSSPKKEEKATPTKRVARQEKKIEKETPAVSAEEVEQREEEKEVAVAIVKELLDKMQVETTVSTRLSKPDDRTGRQINIIEVQGEDLGMLIGSRGETLNAMQYITRLMAGHKLQRRAYFVLDIEGYRRRRERALARLAERMAQKVIKRQEPINLEPMPPNERRVIHVTLRDDDDVDTHSIGEGKRRRVRIIPK
jgi:spoIIIJ-associated protein